MSVPLSLSLGNITWIIIIILQPSATSAICHNQYAMLFIIRYLMTLFEASHCFVSRYDQQYIAQII
jgi:hypothetical protein